MASYEYYKKNAHRKQFKTIIGMDLGDKKHHVCVTDKDGIILFEKTVANNSKQLGKLAHEHRGALFAIEVGTHSPWISRLIESSGCTCLVANARKLRAISDGRVLSVSKDPYLSA